MPASAGRIPAESASEVKLYPLPHTYVVKDLVPDLTHFYKQYKSIKPYLQRDTPAPDVRGTPTRIFFVYGMLTLSRARSTARARRTARSWTASTSAFCAPAARRRAPRTGGTRRSTSRDERKAERKSNLENNMSLYRCHTILNCTRACPKGLNPGKAIAEIKKQMALGA